MNLVAVGTVAFDSIETPFAKKDRVIGGAATYITLAASHFVKNSGLISVIGDDFPADMLEEMRHAYDYIIIDCPPSLGLLTINALVAADEILIPVQAEYYALEGLGQLMETIGLIQKHVKPDLGVLGAVITMFDGRNKLSTDVMNELYKFFPNTIFKSVIPRTVRLAEAPSFGKSIFQYEPNGKGAKAYERLAREILDIHEAIS
jgi:chromosome partitioning protein